MSSLNCESCQYAKLHHVHLSPRVNKRASAPFELIYFDVWGPCLVMSLIGFKYFVTFVDDWGPCLVMSLIMSYFLISLPFSVKFKPNFM